jgi:hypothetical protein
MKLPVRRSTAILVAAFVFTLVLYLLVRPAPPAASLPAGLGDTPKTTTTVSVSSTTTTVP